jgi:hypothetical protein
MSAPSLHSSLIAIAILSCAMNPASAQRKYFEYNNPEAKRITEKMIDKLVAHEWHVTEIKVKVRLDTFTYDGGSVKYNIDGSFQDRNQTDGIWKVEYKRYINHDSKSRHPGVRVFSGIYSILELTDTVLVLQELQTSSREMSRTIWFSKNPSHRRGQAFRTGQVMPIVPLFSGRTTKLTEFQVDSVSGLSDEALFTDGFGFTRDSVIIQTPDSVYRIKRKN